MQLHSFAQSLQLSVVEEKNSLPNQTNELNKKNLIMYI